MAATERITPVSRATLQRLPSYHAVLRELAKTGREHVSCTHIANALHLDPTQVRKDLSVTGIVGRPRIGYDMADLLEAVETFLGWRNAKDAFLVGVGALGTAVLGYDWTDPYGMNILAGFDTSPERIGKEVHGKPVYAIEKLADLAQRMNVPIGIITVPTEHAQETANAMVLAGIRAIWNLTPAELEVPEDVIVENVRLSVSLGVLTSKLNEKIQAEKL
ncbi:MAG: redox-sensing transcriptional repressor Rex [Phycisphaerae bacterium]